MDVSLTGLLKDVLTAFGNWPRWMELGKAPERIEALEKRVAELEASLARAPGEACPRCGERAFRTVESRPAPRPFDRLGTREYVKRREKCGFEDVTRGKG